MWYSYKTCGGKEWVAKAACGNPGMGMTASCSKDFQAVPFWVLLDNMLKRDVHCGLEN